MLLEPGPLWAFKSFKDQMISGRLRYDFCRPFNCLEEIPALWAMQVSVTSTTSWCYLGCSTHTSILVLGQFSACLPDNQISLWIFSLPLKVRYRSAARCQRKKLGGARTTRPVLTACWWLFHLGAASLMRNGCLWRIQKNLCFCFVLFFN